MTQADNAAPKCGRCRDTGWVVQHHYLCACRAGDIAFCKWEGITLEEYDHRAAGKGWFSHAA